MMLFFYKTIYLKLFSPSYNVLLRSLPRNSNLKRYFSASSFLLSQKKLEVQPGFKIKKIVTDYGVVEVKKKLVIPKITLVNPDDTMQIVTLEEAEKIAKRRGLKLVKTVDWDSKTERSTYKLMTATEYAETSRKEKNHKSGSNQKDEKLLNVSARITDHDLEAKVKHILKWLSKEQTVRVVITGDHGNLVPAEKIFDSISESVKDAGRVVQKIAKGGEIKFHIILPKKAKQKTEPTKSEDNGNTTD